jgi:hypothetical protein
VRLTSRFKRQPAYGNSSVEQKQYIQQHNTTEHYTAVEDTQHHSSTEHNTAAAPEEGKKKRKICFTELSDSWEADGNLCGQ